MIGNFKKPRGYHVLPYQPTCPLSWKRGKQATINLTTVLAKIIVLQDILQNNTIAITMPIIIFRKITHNLSIISILQSMLQLMLSQQ